MSVSPYYYRIDGDGGMTYGTSLWMSLRDPREFAGTSWHTHGTKKMVHVALPTVLYISTDMPSIDSLGLLSTYVVLRTLQIYVNYLRRHWSFKIQNDHYK
jgi:hypothetical protein